MSTKNHHEAHPIIVDSPGVETHGASIHYADRIGTILGRQCVVEVAVQAPVT